MLALGADEIVMTPFAEMGPIDPTVSNEFNPVDAQTHQRIGISVEDVKAYIAFVKDTVGIRHEDELVKAVEILAEKVHPLALGNVERFIAQSRLISRKIMMTHSDKDKSQHEIEEIIETLASKLYFHGHPINRKEAKEELGLSVTDNPPPELESLMWRLYLDYEEELQNKIPFDPMMSILRSSPDPTVQPGQMAVIPPGLFSREITKQAIVESARLSSLHQVERRFVVANFGPGGEPSIRAETLSQGWSQTAAPELPQAG